LDATSRAAKGGVNVEKLTDEQAANIIIGIIMASYVDSPTKRELITIVRRWSNEQID
jgi:hypothetical protein